MIGIPLVALVVVRFGWRWGFVMTGVLSFLYFLAFLIVYRDPSKHPRLSAAERKYIRAGGATPECPAQSGEVAMLGYLLLNRKVWGLTIGFAAYGYSFYLFLTWLPNYLEQSELALKFGFYPMGNDFAVLPYLCNFTNDALCGHPITLFDNSSWADGPAGRWTGRVKWHITDELQFQTAAVDANPRYTLRQDGFKLNFTGNTGVIVPAELKYQIGKDPGDYGGTYNLGGYYDSSARADLANPKIFDEGLFGLYAEAAQQIIKWGPGNTDGIALFGVFAVSDQNTAQFKHSYDAGVVSRGVFPGRELDVLSLGWARMTINSRFQFRLAKAGSPIQTSEQLVELNYAFQLTPSLFFRPGVQYDIRPGATSTHPNTWIFDFHIQLTL